MNALTRRATQQGAALIMTVAFMLAAVSFLALSVDTGRLYLDKRTLQRVADMAALEVMTRGGCRLGGGGSAQAQSLAQAAATRNGLVIGQGVTLTAVCGQPQAVGGQFDPALFVADDSGRTVQVTIQRQVPASLISGGLTGQRVNLRAVAAASRNATRIAGLRIRSTLVSTNNEGLINAVLGGLLGSSINLSLLSYQGLVNTQISLFSFLDELAIELNLTVGGYDDVLNTSVSLGRILDVAATVLSRGEGNGTIANVQASLLGLNALRLAIPGTAQPIRIGNLLGIQAGSELAGFDLQTDLLGIVTGGIQLANGNSAIAVDLPVNLLGLATGQVKLKVQEPEQNSAFGDPELARLNPLGPDKIYVRTSQVRLLISATLPILGPVRALIDGLLNNTLVSSLTTTVNNLLSLNLLGAIGDLLTLVSCVLYCDVQQDVVDIQVLQNPRIDINLDAGGGDAYVTNYSCDANRRLNVQTRSSVASIRVGQMGNTDAEAAAAVFSSTAPPTVKAIPIIDIGSRRARRQCTLLLVCNETWRRGSTWVPDRNQADRVAFAGGGIGLKIDSSPNNNNGLLGSSTALVFTNIAPSVLRGVKEPINNWQSTVANNIVSSLDATLTAPQIQIFAPTGGGLGPGLGNVLSLVGGIASGLVSTLQGIISDLLGPLLDPIINGLLRVIGIDLNKVEVGGALTCDSEDGARLIY